MTTVMADPTHTNVRNDLMPHLFSGIILFLFL